MVADYDGYSHDDLYRMVKAGDPVQVDGVAAIWNGMATTAGDFARDLERDLGAVTATWSGAAGAEYAKRMSAMARFSREIASETAAVGSRLTILAQLLREAQAKIEDPADTDDHDKASSYAATGAKVGSMFGLGGSAAGAAAGGVIGWLADDEEADKAKARTAELVKKLAAEYETSGPTDRVNVPEAPVDLPVDVAGATAVGKAVGAGATVGYAAHLGGAAQHKVGHAPAPSAPSRPGVTNSTGFTPSANTGVDDVKPVDISQLGSGLAGVGGDGFTAPTESAGGGFREHNAFTGGSDGLRGGSSQVTGIAGGGVGVAGASRGTSLAGSSSPSAGIARTGDVGLTRPTSSQPPHLTGNRPAEPTEEEQDERTTWLTEDDMAWGDDSAAPPPLLGRRAETD